MMKIRRKAALTLFEMIVAFGIFSIILYVLFGAFREVAFLTDRNSVARVEVLQRVCFHERFTKLVSMAEQDSFSLQDSDISPDKVLQFSFREEKPDPVDPTFSGNLTGQLYRSSENTLVLEIFPYTGDSPPRQEQFFEGVEELNVDLTFNPILEICLKKRDSKDLTFAFFRIKKSIDERPQETPQKEVES